MHFTCNRLVSFAKASGFAKMFHLLHPAIMLAGPLLGVLGCGTASQGTPAGAIVGRPNIYDYSPSMVQTGNQQQFWWCGGGQNPADSSQNSDVILYESLNSVTNKSVLPLIVLGETPGGWDQQFSCNPRVIRGSFVNPVSDGKTYTYEMFYVGTADPTGIANSIGVAFSNDGIAWVKYPEPVIHTSTLTGYGVGQPAIYNEDGKSKITLYYEDSVPMTRHVKAVSTDGIHFIVQGTLTTRGLDPAYAGATWGDMAYDPSTGYWYAAFNMGCRPPSTTGDNLERGQLGIELYRIQNASLLTGATPWELLKTVDTNLTGNESNFLPAFLRDGYGNLNIGPYPSIQMFTSIANPKAPWNASQTDAGLSAESSQWDIGSYTWVPGHPLLALNRYSNGSAYEVTTGWIDPDANFQVNLELGHLYETSQSGATVALYGCASGSASFFVSLDPACESQRVLGLNGYGYAKPSAAQATRPLYRCTSSGKGSFVSNDAGCEGSGTGSLLAYALP